MVKGLKKTSETIAIGFSVDETAANTFTQGSVDLNLDPLNNEVFVVVAINLDPFFSDAIAGVNTRTRAALTTTSQTTMPELNNSNCLARSTNQIQASGFVDGGVGFQQTSLDTGVAIVDFADLSFTGVTLTAAGALIYNTSASNKAVCVLDFGGDKTATAGTFTIVFPAFTSANAILRIS